MGHSLFDVIGCDTDSIIFNKPDGAPFSEEERKNLLDELNKQFPDKIHWADDGYYLKVIVLKAKNYILWDGKKLKTKGSSLKDPKREPALKQFIDEIIQTIIDNKNNFVEIYNKYVTEINDIKDINRWKTKKTISHKVMNPERTTEQKILDAINGSEYNEGDRAYFYYRPDESLSLIDKFDGLYHKDRYFMKLYKTALLFENVINKDIFINYSLKRSKKLMGNL